MSQETECTREVERKERDKEWLESRKAKNPNKVRKSKSKGQDESFIERQTENELEDLLVKTAFSTLL